MEREVAIPATLLIGGLIVAALATKSCWYPAGSRQGKVAGAFARALAAKQYVQAHGFLAKDLAARIDVATLGKQYEDMVSYGSGPATDVIVIFAMDHWPDKRPGDIGWAYAAISGPDFSEAVTVTVADEGGKAVIRQLEWGRP